MMFSSPHVATQILAVSPSVTTPPVTGELIAKDIQRPSQCLCTNISNRVSKMLMQLLK